VKKFNVAVEVDATVDAEGNVIVNVIGFTDILTAVILDPNGIVPATSNTKSPTVIVPVKLAVGTLPVIVTALDAPSSVAVAVVVALATLLAAVLE
jgi:hypothetical protein